MAVQETSESYKKLVEQAANKVREVLGEAKVAIVLGSGLGNFVSRIKNPITLSYNEVPGMPIPTVVGHAGKFVGGKVGDVNVYCMAGRLHRYEGIPPSQITFSVRVFAHLGVETYIATNAAGGAGKEMRKGDIMTLTSHVNFSGFGPMDDVGVGEEAGDKGVGKGEAGRGGGACVVNRVPVGIYSQRLRDHAREVGKKLGTRLQEGVYWCNSGPTYETSCEVLAGVTLGATAFGMSTVPESIVAVSLGMEVCAFSLITNMAAGLTEFALSHEEVAETANESAQEFEGFMESFLSTLPPHVPTPSRPAIVQEEEVPLPLPFTLQRGEEGVKEGAERVKEKLGLEEGVGGLVVVGMPRSKGVEEVGGELEGVFKAGVKCLRLKDIPNFPIVSKASRRGALFSLRSSSSPLPNLLLLTGEEGLNYPESTFLSQILSNFPTLHSSLHLLPSILLPSSQDVEKKSDNENYVVFTDLFPFSTAYPVPEGGEKEGEDIYSSVMQGVGMVEEKSQEVVEGWGVGEWGEGKAAGCAFGTHPMFPSLAEAAIFRQIGCDFASVSSLALLSSLRFSGVSTYALSVPPEMRKEGEGGEEGKKEEGRRYRERFGKFVRFVLGKLAEGKLFQDGQKYRNITYKNTQNNAPQINHNIMCPFPSVERERVVREGEKVKERLRELVGEEGVKVAVVVDEHLGGGWGAWEEVKGWVEFGGLVEGDVECNGKFAVIDVDDTKVLFLQSRSLRRGDSTATVSAPVRLLHELGVKFVVGLVNVVSCDEKKFPVGSNIFVRDYVNLSQRNALFGENEKEWGVRFLDQQQLYGNDLLSHVVGEVKGVEKAVGGYVIGPMFKGEVMKNYLVQSGVEVAGVSVFPETVTAHHMNDKCLMLGVVTDSFSSSSSSFVPSWDKGGFKDVVVQVCQSVDNFSKK